MRYTVRTSAGELDFEDIAALRESFRQGLVEPDDEVREGPTGAWTPARKIPVLAISLQRPAPPKRLFSLEMMLLIALLLAALVLLFLGQWAVGGALALLGALFLTRTTRRSPLR